MLSISVLEKREGAVAAFEKLVDGSIFAELFRRIRWVSATAVVSASFAGLIAGDSVAAPYQWQYRLPFPTASTPYDGARQEVWNAAQNCFNHATKDNVNKWQLPTSICYVPKFAFEAGPKDYKNRLILYWDKDKKQVLLVPVDYISGVEANQFYGGNVLLPDYWSQAIDALDSMLKSNPYKAPSGGGYGIAMNSANFRTRDQLHLHICTVDKEVIDAITAKNPGEAFINIPVKNGHAWWTRKFTKTDDGWARTFLSSTEPASTVDKANVSIAVIEDTKSNYWLLYNQMGKPVGEKGTGAETLLQSGCNNAGEPK